MAFQRFAACACSAALLCAGLFSACSSPAQSYEILGELIPAESQEPTEYDFGATLRDLYPQSDLIVTGQVSEVSEGRAQISVLTTLEGQAPTSSLSIALPQDAQPTPGESYLFFLLLGEDGYTALVDGAGLIVYTGELLQPAHEKVSAPYSRAVADIQKMQRYVYIPAYFTYYRELDQLISNSSLILTGTVRTIEQEKDYTFYVRESGLQEIVTAETTAITIYPNMMLKGELPQSDITVLLSDNMLTGTINDSTSEQPTYTYNDRPPLEEEGTYLFFLVDSPVGKHSAYRFFVNPFQGYVPLINNETLISIPINAPFSYIQTLEDVLYEVESVLGDEGGSVEYQPFELEDFRNSFY